MYNKQVLSEALANLQKRKAKLTQPKDIIVDPRGQYDNPGEITRIYGEGNGTSITMQPDPKTGKPITYPVMAYPNVGQPQMMYPEQNYNFPGADYVDEVPLAKYGGLVTGLRNTSGNLLMSKKGKRLMAQSGSLSATNELFLGNPLLTKRKKAVYVRGAAFQDGGVSPLEGDLISKVLMERNRGTDFVDRAFALGDTPGTPMFNLPDDEQFGQNMSHKMAWGEDDAGQAWMFPTVMNPNDEAIQVPNQYADYISSQGYKNATGMQQKGGFIDIKLTDEEIEEYRRGGYIVEEYNDGGVPVPPPKKKNATTVNTRLFKPSEGNNVDYLFLKDVSYAPGSKELQIENKDSTEVVKEIRTDNWVWEPSLNMYVNRPKRSLVDTGTNIDSTVFQQGGTIPKFQTGDEKKPVPNLFNFDPTPEYVGYQGNVPVSESTSRSNNNYVPTQKEVKEATDYSNYLAKSAANIQKRTGKSFDEAKKDAEQLIQFQSQPKAEIRQVDPEGKDKNLVYLDNAGDAKTVGDYANVAWGVITNPIDAATAFMSPGGFGNNFYIDQNPVEKMMGKGYVDYDRVQNNAMMNATSSLGYMLPFIGAVAQGKDLYQAGVAFYENPSWHEALNIGLAASPGAFKRVPNSIPVGLNQVRPVVKNTIKELDKLAGKAYGRYAERNLKMPEINYDDISKNVNQLISKGDLGIIKPNIRNKYEIKLQPSSVVKDDLEVGVINKATNEYIPTGSLSLPFSHASKQDQTLSKIIKKHGRDVTNVKKVGKDLFSLPRSGFTDYGLRKAGDFPFSNLYHNVDLLTELKGSGISAEINQALNKTLKQKGLQLYSGATGHTSEGASRYLRELLAGRVSPTNNPNLTYLMNLYNHHKKTGNKRAELMVLRQIEPEIYNSNFKFYKQGGRVLDLSEDEIRKYQEAGYVVEKYQDGGDVKSSHGWDYKKEGDKYFTKKVGTDKWIEPTGEALKAIQQKVFGDIEYTESDKKSDYINNVQKLISSGYTLDDLVKQRVGTKEGLTKLFPELSKTKSTTTAKSKEVTEEPIEEVATVEEVFPRRNPISLGLKSYNRAPGFSTDVEAIKARAMQSLATSKAPTRMPVMPSWQEHAFAINQGLTKPEYTEAELTDEEIAELQAQGHIVEEVTEPEPWLNSLQNNVSQQSIYNTDNVTLDPFGRKSKYGPTEEQMLKLQEFMKTPEEKGLKSWKPELISLKGLGDPAMGPGGFSYTLGKDSAEKLKKVEEVLAGISTEGVSNVIEQIQQGTSDSESLGEVKVIKEEEPVKETEPVYNIQDLDPFKFVGERKGEIIQTYIVPLINEPDTSLMYRNRGDESDIMGKKLAYTYAPFKPYKETLNKKYGSLSVNDNTYVIALTADGIKGGKLKDFKDTDTPLSPTYVTENVTELVIEPDNKYFDGIGQKGLGLKTSKDTVKYIPVGTADSQSGSFKNWSGGHLLVENPKTKVMVVLHGRSDQLKEMFNKYLETEGIESANIYETDHKAYSLITNPKDGIHKGSKNRQLDNYNTERSGAGNFIYLQEINE